MAWDGTTSSRGKGFGEEWGGTGAARPVLRTVELMKKTPFSSARVIPMAR
jgi:hypothetical protein